MFLPGPSGDDHDPRRRPLEPPGCRHGEGRPRVFPHGTRNPGPTAPCNPLPRHGVTAPLTLATPIPGAYAAAVLTLDPVAVLYCVVSRLQGGRVLILMSIQECPRSLVHGLKSHVSASATPGAQRTPAGEEIALHSADCRDSSSCMHARTESSLSSYIQVCDLYCRW